MPKQRIKLREVAPADLDRCFEIERIAYHGDEAASREKISKRIAVYPEGFVVLEIDGEVAGFINSGATHDVDLANEDFKELKGHDPDGPHVVVLSVAIHPDHQGKRFANVLMEHFVSKMKTLNKASIHLMCQTSLVAMYTKQGFHYIGASASTHGGLKWHEMNMILIDPAA